MQNVCFKFYRAGYIYIYMYVGGLQVNAHAPETDDSPSSDDILVGAPQVVGIQNFTTSAPLDALTFELSFLYIFFSF